MELEFITELCESRLVRQKGQMKQFTAKDAADLVFLYLCTLNILKNVSLVACEDSRHTTKIMNKYENMGSMAFPNVFNDLTDCYSNMSVCLCGLCCPTCLFYFTR